MFLHLSVTAGDTQSNLVLSRGRGVPSPSDRIRRYPSPLGQDGGGGGGEGEPPLAFTQEDFLVSSLTVLFYFVQFISRVSRTQRDKTEKLIVKLT